jgi:NitT/TauT family transport system substrate-binding protein
MHQFAQGGIAAALAALLLAPPASADDVLKIAAGQRGSWETGISDLGQRAGIFKRHGLELQIVYTQGSGETQQAVISGSVDIGIAVGTFGALGAYAKGAPVRAIGATMTGANDLFWYVRADSPIRSFKDTAGKTVA